MRATLNHESAQQQQQQQQLRQQREDRRTVLGSLDTCSYTPLPSGRPATASFMPTSVLQKMIPGCDMFPHPNYDIYNPLMESCATKAIIGTAIGWVMGIALGLFMGALGGEMASQQQYVLHKSGLEPPQAPVLEQMRVSYRAMGKKALGMGASFAALTAIFQGVECVVEKHRAKHDLANGMISGCAAGAGLSAKSGPQAACLGCVGFAAFSVAIELVMGPH